MDLFLKKIFRKHRLTHEIQLRFLKRLARLLFSGYSVIEALDVIMWDQDLTSLAEQLKQAFIRGYTIDEAFREAGFHPLIVSQLYFIRLNGDLDQVMQKCIDMFEQRHRYLKKFQQVIRYPIILTIIFMIILYSLQKFIYPVFIDLFQMNVDSVAIIEVSLVILNILGKIIIIGIFVSVGIVLFWLTYQAKCPIETKLKWYEKIPVFRHYLKIHTTFQLAVHMSSSLKTGLPFKDILTHLSIQSHLPIVAHYAELMMKELNQGYHLEPLLLELTFIDRQLAYIFQKNNNVHMLQQDLSIYADWLIEDLQQKLLKLFEMIQPLFFSLLAVLIILMYIMLMWPMFDMMKMI